MGKNTPVYSCQSHMTAICQPRAPRGSRQAHTRELATHGGDVHYDATAGVALHPDPCPIVVGQRIFARGQAPSAARDPRTAPDRVTRCQADGMCRTATKGMAARPVRRGPVYCFCSPRLLAHCLRRPNGSITLETDQRS